MQGTGYQCYQYSYSSRVYMLTGIATSHGVHTRIANGKDSSCHGGKGARTRIACSHEDVRTRRMMHGYTAYAH